MKAGKKMKNLKFVTWPVWLKQVSTVHRELGGEEDKSMLDQTREN